MGSGLGIDEFLNHSGKSGGGSVLSWREDGQVVIWLHPKSPIHALWRHNWFDVVEVEDKDTKEKERKVFSRRFVCHERELINKKQNFRDKVTKEREYPPEVCPMDFMVDCVVDLVVKGELNWTDPVFEFIGDDPTSEYNVTLTAGGIYNAFKQAEKGMTKEQRAELRKAGIRMDEAWKQDTRVKLNYLFTGVADPTEGIVQMIEPKGLGDKMKGAIRDRVRVKGRDAGDPTKNPYPFEWTYDEEKDFDDKYHVVALEDKPSAEVLALLREAPPSTTQFTDPGDCFWLFESMQEHCVSDVLRPHIGEWFVEAKKRGLMQPKPKKEAAHDDSDDEDEAPASEPAPKKGTAKTKEPEPEPDQSDDQELYECDHCGTATLGETDTKCSACGAEYDGKTNRLIARPCNECKTLVKLDGDGPFICPKCATIHELVEQGEGDNVETVWMTRKKGGAPKEEPQQATRRRRVVEEPKKEAGSDDSIPWGKK